MLLPPNPGDCQQCAVDHEPEQPHNQQSLYWQYWFYGKHGRWPTWHDAMRHCTEDIRQFWTKALQERGVDLGEDPGEPGYDRTKSAESRQEREGWN